MALNAEDGGRRKYIMVQLAEKCAENTEAFKAGYKNICEIGKERIRRAGKKIKDTAPLTTQNLDVGFRVLKLDSSNFREEIFLPAAEWTQELILDAVENIKRDRTALDLLFGCLTDYGVELGKSCTEETFDGVKIYNYNGGEILACFEENISLEVVKHVAEQKPRHAFFRDSSFERDADRINAIEFFKYYTKSETCCKII